jgi:hypothetical protein
MRPVNITRTLASLALAFVGSFFYFVSSIGYSPGFSHLGVGPSLIAAFSVLCLLGAAVIALESINMPNEEARVPEMAYAAVYLGLFLAFASQFIPFPVGCNLDAWPYNLTNVFHGCPAGPEGVWSTIWPNTLTTCVGVVLVTTGYGKTRSRDVSLPGLGLGLMISGFVLLVLGLSIGYTTFCPANGCPPLTASQWWSIFWPDVIADILGTTLIIAGLVLIARWRSKDKWLIRSETSPSIPSSTSDQFVEPFNSVALCRLLNGSATNSPKTAHLAQQSLKSAPVGIGATKWMLFLLPRQSGMNRSWPWRLHPNVGVHHANPRRRSIAFIRGSECRFSKA